MSTRKPHRKSRKGCLTCKSRHTKCGEEQPICQNCIEFELQCQYLEASAPSKKQPCSSPGSSRFQSRSRSSDRDQHAAIPESDINTSDLELLHHFSTSTYLTMSNVPLEQKIWQTTLVTIGLQHKFLLRGILALSALHLSCLKSGPDSIDYMVKASKHQNIGLAEFRKALETINASTFDALLAFSCLVPIHSMAINACSAYRPTNLDHNILSEFLNSLSLFRSVNSLLLPSLDVYTSSTISPLLQFTTQKLPEPSTYPGIDSLDRLEIACTAFSMMTTSLDREAERETFSSAIALLRSTFATTVDTQSTDRFTIGAILIWTIAVSDEFYVQLTRRYPSALAILAHFAVLLHRFNDVWWLQGLGHALIERISAEIGVEWVEVVRWPMMVAGLT